MTPPSAGTGRADRDRASADDVTGPQSVEPLVRSALRVKGRASKTEPAGSPACARGRASVVRPPEQGRRSTDVHQEQQRPRVMPRRHNPPHQTPSGTWCWWGQPDRERRLSSRRLLAATGTTSRMGSVVEGTTDQRLRRGGDPPATLGRAVACAGARRRDQGEPARRPRLCGLRRRPSRRPARRRLRALRRLRERGCRRGDEGAVAGVRGRRDAAHRRDQQAQPPARRLLRRPGGRPERVRRQGRAALRARAARRLGRRRPCRAHLTDRLGLLQAAGRSAGPSGRRARTSSCSSTTAAARSSRGSSRSPRTRASWTAT